MANTKILHLSSAKTWRGGEQQIAYLLTYSKQHNVDVVVLARKGSAMLKWCEQNNVECYQASFTNGLDIPTAFKIKKLATQLAVDAVHLHSGKSHSLAFLAVQFGMKEPLIVHRRVDFPLKSGGPSLKKYNHPSVKAIICVSDTIRDMVREKISAPNIARTVYSGIDFSRFQYPKNRTGFLAKEFGIASDKISIANISALAPHKDYPTFLTATKQYTATSNDAHFYIIGDGPLQTELHSMSKEMGLDNQLTFTGFRKDIPEIFQEIDVFLITSSTEGLGTTVIDAMYNGLPIIATRGGGIPELVRDGIEGVLCDVGDAPALAKAIEKLASDPELRATYGKNAHKRAHSFTSEEMGKGVLEVYSQVLT